MEKDKLSDFVERFWHFDLITSMSLEKFTEEYIAWAREKKYHRSRSKAEAVYELASSGIPTLSSSTPSTKNVSTGSSISIEGCRQLSVSYFNTNARTCEVLT